MEPVQIETKSKSYPVFIGAGMISQLEGYIKEALPAVTKVLIITDENVGERYLTDLEQALSSLQPLHFIVPGGESCKTFDVYHSCLTYCLEQKLDRKSLILAFGGGAVGDLSGFVAATYMRGISFIQLPTTILAHDSAVGGKVAINHELGKNLIGAFYQPEAVFYDLDFLQSLPVHERRSGFAEVIKHALIRDQSFYLELREAVQDLERISEEQLHLALKKGILIKGATVAEDEKEHGVRAFLNFGHTLGHAIEGEAGYGNLTHGEAVAIGMLFALRLSKELLNLSFDLADFEEWMKELGYKTGIIRQFDPQRLLERMKQDKKTIGGQVQFVLLESIGSPLLMKLEDSLLLEKMKQFKEEVEADD